MATDRKSALKTLLGLLPRVEEHLQFLADEPESPASNHWRSEIGNWLREMEEVLPYVGKKTAQEWQERLQVLREGLEVSS